MRTHESHNWRYSDSSLYDLVCTQCNCTDASDLAQYACGKPPEVTRFVELAREAGIKAHSEYMLSPRELKFAELIIKECSAFADPVTRKFMFKHFGMETE